MATKSEGFNGFPLDGSQSTQMKYNIFAEKMAKSYEDYNRRQVSSSPTAMFGIITAIATILISLIVFLFIGIRWIVLKVRK